MRYILLLITVLISQTLFSQDFLKENTQRAERYFAQLDSKASYESNLNRVDMNMLPSGFRQTINNMDVTVAVYSAEFHTDYIAFSAFLRLIVPGEKQKILFFGANDIKLSYEGDIIGDAELSLLGDIEIPVSDGNIILRLKGNFNAQTGQSERQTYVAIDCQGFKALGVTAEIELSSRLCLPVDAGGQVIPDGKVSGRFQMEIENWNDIVASVSFPSFSINGLNGFIWDVRNAVFDFSDLKNGEGFHFPEAYRPYIVPGNETLWQGVYIQSLNVTLPPCFSQNSEKRVSFSAKDMLIDDNGITGSFSAENLLAFEQGSAGGWSFSVNRFGLDLVANHLEGASFGGEIGLPISEASRLGYDGYITADDKYILRINPIDGFSFDLLQAKAELYANSYLELKVENGKFKPEAMLHGRMSIAAKLSSEQEEGSEKEIAQIRGVEFRGLHLKTESPFLSVEYLGYDGEISLLNFPVSINKIAFETRGNEAALSFGLNLALMKGDLGASTRLSIQGKMEEGRLQRWKYNKTTIEDIQINATIAEMIELKGALSIMNDDPIYGDGFGGSLDVSFIKTSPLNGLNVKVRGIFGHTDFRYWFVDGIATLPGAGMPIGTGLFLNGFGGGVSYCMKPMGIQSTGAVMSATAMQYVPDQNSSLGIKAATAFSIGNENITNGEACFELSFNSRGGLSYAGFYGFAQIASSISGLDNFEKIAAEKYQKLITAENNFAGNNEALTDALKKYKQYEPQKAGEILSGKKDEVGQGGLRACVGIQFNFAESSFHATFDLYANLLGGIIRGVGQRNRAGYAVVHIDPSDWYIYMGTPTDRIGLRMGFGSILNIETGSYLMAGTKIPDAPGVPAQLASILGYTPDNLNYMKELNLLGDGKGFAFGSSMSINTGDLQFLILYANYSAGIGFDIMLKNYGDAQCKGRNGAVGMDGWYANGQAYAYMHGELGAKINLWFLKAKVPIFRADIGALMQAKLPNPSSFKAYLAVKAKVLGIVSVNCRFKILIGDDCELVIPGGSPLDMAMISDLSPTDAANDVSVFTAPQATFNMAVEKAFDVQDDSGEKTFRIRLRDFTLNDGQDITGKLKWNADKDVVSFYSHEVLPPEKEVTATVNVVFEELRNGKWNPVYTAGKEAVESKTIRFRTAGAPDVIPLQNVMYAYPVVGQRYFLKGEGEGKGYIQLQYGQNYLFPAGLKNQIQLEDKAGNKQLTDFKYNQELRRIDFTMPQTGNGAGYSVSVVSLSAGADGSASGRQVSQTLLDNEDEGSISVESKTASTEIRTDLGKVLLSYDFASSRYSTFSQKMEALQKTRATAVGISSDVLMFGYETTGMEPFDMADLSGTEQTEQKPLVDVTATLEDEYYLSRIYPLIYKDYPVDGLFRVKRTDVELIGVPPAKALPIRTDYLNRIEQGIFDGVSTGRFPYYYNLPAVYKEDFIDLQNQTVGAFVVTGKSSVASNRFLTGSFPFILPGTYRIVMQYILPGGVKGSSATFDYTNFIQ